MKIGNLNYSFWCLSLKSILCDNNIVNCNVLFLQLIFLRACGLFIWRWKEMYLLLAKVYMALYFNFEALGASKIFHNEQFLKDNNAEF